MSGDIDLHAGKIADLGKEMVHEYESLAQVLLKIHDEKYRSHELVIASIAAAIQHAINMVGFALSNAFDGHRQNVIDQSKKLFNDSLDKLLDKIKEQNN